MTLAAAFSLSFLLLLLCETVVPFAESIQEASFSSSTSPIVTAADCENWQTQGQQLMTKINTVASLADKSLVPSLFPTVARGYQVVVVNETIGEKTGGGTNPYGSYGALVFNGSQILPDSICAIPTNSGEPRCGENGLGYTTSFILGPRDVIAFLVCTPPSMRYFSYDVDLVTRITEEYPFYPGQIFGDPISIQTINVTASEEQQVKESTDKFLKPALILIAADAEAASNVAKSYISSGGMDPASISVYSIPQDTVRVWDRSVSLNTSRPDLLSLISRLTGPLGGKNDPAYMAYQSAVWPARFYFAANDEKSFSPLQPLIKARCSETESAVLNETASLQAAYRQLEEAVTQQFPLKLSPSGTTQYTTAILTGNLTSEGFYDDWEYVLSKKNNDTFILPTRDAIYGVPVFKSDRFNEQFLVQPGKTGAVLMGVVHSAAMDAQYSSSGIDLSAIEGILKGKNRETHWLMDVDLLGSAERYLPSAVVAKSSLLYAIDLQPPNGCKGYPSEEQKWCIEYSAKDSLNTILGMGERAYGVKATNIGPCASATLASQLIAFQPVAQ